MFHYPASSFSCLNFLLFYTPPFLSSSFLILLLPHPPTTSSYSYLIILSLLHYPALFVNLIILLFPTYSSSSLILPTHQIITTVVIPYPYSFSFILIFLLILHSHTLILSTCFILLPYFLFLRLPQLPTASTTFSLIPLFLHPSPSSSSTCPTSSFLLLCDCLISFCRIFILLIDSYSSSWWFQFSSASSFLMLIFIYLLHPFFLFHLFYLKCLITLAIPLTSFLSTSLYLLLFLLYS